MRTSSAMPKNRPSANFMTGRSWGPGGIDRIRIVIGCPTNINVVDTRKAERSALAMQILSPEG